MADKFSKSSGSQGGGRLVDVLTFAITCLKKAAESSPPMPSPLPFCPTHRNKREAGGSYIKHKHKNRYCSDANVRKKSICVFRKGHSIFSMFRIIYHHVYGCFIKLSGLCFLKTIHLLRAIHIYFSQFSSELYPIMLVCTVRK